MKPESAGSFSMHGPRSAVKIPMEDAREGFHQPCSLEAPLGGVAHRESTDPRLSSHVSVAFLGYVKVPARPSNTYPRLAEAAHSG